MLEDFRQKILYLNDLKLKHLIDKKSLTSIPIFPYGDTIRKLPTTL